MQSIVHLSSHSIALHDPKNRLSSSVLLSVKLPPTVGLVSMTTTLTGRLCISAPICCQCQGWGHVVNKKRRIPPFLLPPFRNVEEEEEGCEEVKWLL